MIKRLLAITLAFVLCFVPVTVTAAEAEGDTPLGSVQRINHGKLYTVSGNDYIRWSWVVGTYLVELPDGGFLRVEHKPHPDTGEGVLVVETYSNDFVLTDSKELIFELPCLGGFLYGEDYIFVVYGDWNLDGSDDVEVLRVVKYDKSFNRLAAISIYGANTTKPFDAGSLRMTEASGLLYIHTCHEMYSGHQANMTFVFNQSDLSPVDYMHYVMNISIGYVSHSFNQFIVTDGSYIYRVDHGDAYPRSVVVTRCAVGDKITNVTYQTAYDISWGEAGDNYTGVSVGGVEMSDSKLIIAGNSVDMSTEETYLKGRRNIFLSIMDKNLENTSTVWLTDYASDGDLNARTPHLVKLSADRFFVMWEEYDYSTGNVRLCSVTVDGNGTAVTPIVRNPYRLSECKPILCSDGAVRWYASDYDKTLLYTLDPQRTTPMIIEGDVNGDGSVDNLDAAYVLRYDAEISELTEAGLLAADVNGDQTVDSADAAAILKYEAGLISSFAERDVQ